MVRSRKPPAQSRTMALRGVRSPPPDRTPPGAAPDRTSGAILGRTDQPRAPGGAIDWRRVEDLAAHGLTLDQIAAELDWAAPPPSSERVRLEAAIKRGRALGSAALKRKHYEAAINGSVTAQKGMLALLEAEEDDDERVDVEQVILTADAGDAGSGEPND